jgi:uncharacterized membrane protein (UPF0182 family)
MAIPIEQSFLYVEPVYLQASQESTPQVETAGRRARSSMRRPERPTLSVALPELKRVIVAYGNEVVMKEDLVSALAAIFKEMAGDWGEYGEALGRMEKILEELAQADKSGSSGR